MAIITNPITGVQYDEHTGHSIKRYVAVQADGIIRNPSGNLWPYNEGGVHPDPFSYYELVPFVSSVYDEELFFVDIEQSGWKLKPYPNGAPQGHPQGTYEYSEVIRRRSVSELKALAKSYADRNNTEIWPQENGYDAKLAYAEKQIKQGNRLPIYLDLIERHEKVVRALFHNSARLEQLYAEIDAAGLNGSIDFVIGQMATEDFPEGWVNGIE